MRMGTDAMKDLMTFDSSLKAVMVALLRSRNVIVVAKPGTGCLYTLKEELNRDFVSLVTILNLPEETPTNLIFDEVENASPVGIEVLERIVAFLTMFDEQLTSRAVFIVHDMDALDKFIGKSHRQIDIRRISEVVVWTPDQETVQ